MKGPFSSLLYFATKCNISTLLFVYKQFFIHCLKFHRICSKGAHLIKFQIRMDYSHGARTLISTVTSKRYELSRQTFFLQLQLVKILPSALHTKYVPLDPLIKHISEPPVIEFVYSCSGSIYLFFRVLMVFFHVIQLSRSERP